jgi:hypothetical protein
LKDINNALITINKAIILQTDNADHYDTRADVYLAKKDFISAIADSRWVMEHCNDANLLHRSEERLQKLGINPRSLLKKPSFRQGCAFPLVQKA